VDVLNLLVILFLLSRSLVKYQIARDDVDISEYIPQNIPDFQNVTKPESILEKNILRIFINLLLYSLTLIASFILSIDLTFYNP